MCTYFDALQCLKLIILRHRTTQFPPSPTLPGPSARVYEARYARNNKLPHIQPQSTQILPSKQVQSPTFPTVLQPCPCTSTPLNSDFETTPPLFTTRPSPTCCPVKSRLPFYNVYNAKDVWEKRGVVVVFDEARRAHPGNQRAQRPRRRHRAWYSIDPGLRRVLHGRLLHEQRRRGQRRQFAREADE